MADSERFKLRPQEMNERLNSLPNEEPLDTEHKLVDDEKQTDEIHAKFQDIIGQLTYILNNR